MENLIKLITTNHSELITYYELNNFDKSLDVKGLVRAYDLDKRYHTSFRIAVHAAYLSIKRLAKREDTIKRLETEFSEEISKL